MQVRIYTHQHHILPAHIIFSHDTSSKPFNTIWHDHMSACQRHIASPHVTIFTSFAHLARRLIWASSSCVRVVNQMSAQAELKKNVCRANYQCVHVVVGDGDAIETTCPHTKGLDTRGTSTHARWQSHTSCARTRMWKVRAHLLLPRFFPFFLLHVGIGASSRAVVLKTRRVLELDYAHTPCSTAALPWGAACMLRPLHSCRTSRQSVSSACWTFFFSCVVPGDENCTGSEDEFSRGLGSHTRRCRLAHGEIPCADNPCPAQLDPSLGSSRRNARAMPSVPPHRRPAARNTQHKHQRDRGG